MTTMHTLLGYLVCLQSSDKHSSDHQLPPVIASQLQHTTASCTHYFSSLGGIGNRLLPLKYCYVQQPIKRYIGSILDFHMISTFTVYYSYITAAHLQVT
jgi:hypothetical protein